MPFQPGSSNDINLRLRYQPASPFSMRIDLALALSSTTFHQTQPIVQVAPNIIIYISATDSDSERLLKRKSNHLFVSSESFSLFQNKRIELQELLQVVPNVCHVPRGLGFSTRDQTSVYKFSRKSAGFGSRIEEEL